MAELNWLCIKAILLEQDGLRRLLHKYSKLFKDELDTITPHKAKLVVASTVKSQLHRPWPVAYALCPFVEQELDCLERVGVLVKVDHSEWAAPIVIVPKQDGNVRIRGDYKVTINPVLDIDQCPLPRMDDLFAKLAGGSSFQL